MKYYILQKGNVNVEIRNLIGEKVEELKLGVRVKGDHNIQIDTERLRNGIYLISLISEGFVSNTKKLVIIK